MKKLISLLCVLAVTVGILAVGAISAAAEVPTTEVEVKSGDKVTYVLELGDCNEKVVGCDFSIYFDENVLKVESVADFNNSTNDEDWSATINPALPGEVRGNWSILKGVDFSKKRNFITVNFAATKDAKTHLSYFIRYMYGNSVFDSDSRPQMAQYTFTCSVTVDGKAVVENAQPELNVEETQPNGLFENSRTGKSDDADAALSGDSIKKNGGVNDNNGSGSNSNNNSGNNNSGNNSGSNSGNNGNSSDSDKKTDNNKSDNKSSDADKNKTQSASENKNSGSSSDNKTVQTDADGKLVEGATVAGAGSTEKKSGGSLMWVIIAAVVLIAGGSIAYVAFKGKKNAAPAVDEAKSDEKKSDEKKSDEPVKEEPVIKVSEKDEPVTEKTDDDEPVTKLIDKEDK